MNFIQNVPFRKTKYLCVNFLIILMLKKMRKSKDKKDLQK